MEILLTTPHAVVARQAPIKRQDLNEKIAAYRKTLSSPSQDPLPQAKALYQLLVGPIADDLHQAGARTLMLSLDDTLRYLPFAALHDDKGYLIESMSVVMVTEAVRDKLAASPNAKWSVWGLGVTRGGDGYSPLPYVGAELNGITGDKGILVGKVMLDKQFNEGSLRDGLDQGYPIIHIASHFQFTPGSMDDSFLLLGDGSRMTLAQIKTKLNFNGVELLTLSACETALGDDSVAHHGVEVEGLGAIAQQAGAKAVLATLWPVADGSTALLMRALYQAHKSDHVDKADALRDAQLALLRGTAHSDSAGKAERGLTRVDSPSGGRQASRRIRTLPSPIPSTGRHSSSWATGSNHPTSALDDYLAFRRPEPLARDTAKFRSKYRCTSACFARLVTPLLRNNMCTASPSTKLARAMASGTTSIVGSRTPSSLASTISFSKNLRHLV